MSLTSTPKVSCLMVTANRKALCRRAVRCYLHQTYPNKELVVLNNGSEDLEDILVDVPTTELRYVHIERTPGLFIGGLRNQSLEMAGGTYIIPQWDDDDWYHPDRIQKQVDILNQGYDACTLKATLMHLDQEPYIIQPYYGILPKGVPPTLMHRLDLSIEYPNLRRTSDSYYLSAWQAKKHALLPVDQAYLYIRCFHGTNLWGVDHFLRRMRNNIPDLVAYGWYRYIRRDLFNHPRFRLDKNATEAFKLFYQDSKELDLLPRS